MKTKLSEFFFRLKDNILYIHTAKLILTTMAIIHGFLAIIFGIGISITGNHTSAKSYSYLVRLPGWPESVGLTFVFIGIVLVYSRFRAHDQNLTSAVAFFALACVTFMYGAWFLAGSIAQNGLFGPQVMYMGFSTLHFLHAVYSVIEWLKGKEEKLDYNSRPIPID